MSLDELLDAANKLNESDLETLINRMLLIRAQRKVPILSSEEASLLTQINQGIPSDLHEHYCGLAQKRDAETLTDEEYEELLQISDRIEVLNAQRIEALVKLAALRQISLQQLMGELGIQFPSYA
jgi:hypothetical protein